MDNYNLLEKYRKKLSLYFTLFILFSFWFIQAFFLIIEYVPRNIEIQQNLEKKFLWVKNIIENHESYSKKLNNKDVTLGKILVKSLENVIIFEWCNAWVCSKKLVSNIDEEYELIYKDKQYFFDIWNNKYLKKYFTFKNIEYQVIIKMKNEYSLIKMLNYYFYFLFFSIPFMILFYFIWYYFVGKNFKPIKQTISWLEDFTANINHEMKTPLAEIISTLSLAKKIKNYDEAIDSSLESTKKLNKILDSMLWIVNLLDSSYKKQRFDLIKELKLIILENITKIEKKKIIIKTDFKDKSYFLKTNKEHFDICIWNILKNAIKYSDKKWIIEIYFEDWKLEIKDYWIGISKKNLKNIFNRYFRENYTKEEGYWIGLALVKKIIDIHSWKIKIKSQKRRTVNGCRWTKVIINF